MGVGKTFYDPDRWIWDCMQKSALNHHPRLDVYHMSLYELYIVCRQHCAFSLLAVYAAKPAVTHFSNFSKTSCGLFCTTKERKQEKQELRCHISAPFLEVGGELGRSPQTWPVPLEQPACLTAENASNYMFGAVEEGPAAAGNLRLRRGANSV